MSHTRSLVVRTRGAPEAVLEPLQQAVWSVDSDVPVYAAETLDALVARRVGSFGVIAGLMGAFGLMSLVLGAVGIYGVTAHAVGQRTAEIGIPMALRAERRRVARMLLAQGMVRAALGVALGLIAAFALGSAMGGILIGVSPWEPSVYTGVGSAVAGVSLPALYLPIRSAARVDPSRALAAE